MRDQEVHIWETGALKWGITPKYIRMGGLARDKNGFNVRKYIMQCWRECEGIWTETSKKHWRDISIWDGDKVEID